MGWLLETAGFDVLTIIGGYKAYRTLVMQAYESQPLKLILLGGKTGSGKTLILKQLRDAGEQIMDLEQLAHHKGSAFGWIGEPPQPTVEQFENHLFDVFRQLDPNRRIWVENESRTIGSAVIPAGFWTQMKGATLIHLEVPYEARIKHLVDIYTQTNVADLLISFEKIEKKLGKEALKNATEALNQGDFETATRIALKYYDKIYMQLFDNNPIAQKTVLKVENATPKIVARQLIDWANS
jgi:tRNA 2-selenouridine synthase